MIRQDGIKQNQGCIGCWPLLIIAAMQTSIWTYLVVSAHRDHAKAVANIPHYQADCAHATWYSPLTPDLPCYDVQTYIVLKHHSGKHSYNSITLRLPNYHTVTAAPYDAVWGAHPPPSGSYAAEIWNGAVTRIFVKGQTIRTYNNPVAEAENTNDSSLKFPLVMAVVFGSLFVIGGISVIVALFKRNR